jgi:hypothetical protein
LKIRFNIYRDLQQIFYAKNQLYFKTYKNHFFFQVYQYSLHLDKFYNTRKQRLFNMYNKSFARNQKLLYFKTYKNHFFFKWTNSIWTSLLQKQKLLHFTILSITVWRYVSLCFLLHISDNTILVLFHQDKSLTRKQKNNYFILDFKTYKNPFFCVP